MQQQIEDEIEDEIALAKEEDENQLNAHKEIVKKRKLQSIRKVD